MDMSGMGGMSMGSMDMGSGIPNLFYLQKMYWAVLGAVIAVATTVNVFNKLIRWQRVHAAAVHAPTPAKPKNPVLCAYATATAIVREIAYLALPPVHFWRLRLRFFPAGKVIIILAHLTVTMVFCFYKLNAKDQWQWEDIGYRTGFMAICQLPLIFLLASKNNIVGFLIGSSYERLNWLHRWTARILFLTVTIHMGFWMTSWARYNYILNKLQSDPITQKGFAAWVVLLWIVVSSIMPIRGWCYEFFVVQHIVSFVGFIVIVYMHTPAEVHVWVWIPVGLFVFDRLVRSLFVVYNNLSILHGWRHRSQRRRGVLACQAKLTPLPHNTTRITIDNPPFNWKPGQHVFLSCHSVVPLQSHPFTIASLPSDGKIELLANAHSGGTRRLFRRAKNDHETLPLVSDSVGSDQYRSVIVDGPYGRMRELDQFDSVVLFAGGVGATFIVPLFRDLLQHWKSTDQPSKPKPVTRHVRFVWVVKSKGQMSWFAEQLEEVVQELVRYRTMQAPSKKTTPRSKRTLESGDGLTVEMSIYVTCDSTMTGESNTSSTDKLPNPHGRVEEIREESQESLDEKPRLSMSAEERPQKTTSPNASCCGSKNSSAEKSQCCCTRTIPSETEGETPPCTCNCNTTATASSSSSSSFKDSESESNVPPYSRTNLPYSPPSRSPTSTSLGTIPLLTGRPYPQNIIRSTLERAHGETGVIVCGPVGLADDVRRSVVELSDERAVHKGTGAQGVWLWTEGFGY